MFAADCRAFASTCPNEDTSSGSLDIEGAKHTSSGSVDIEGAEDNDFTRRTSKMNKNKEAGRSTSGIGGSTQCTDCRRLEEELRNQEQLTRDTMKKIDELNVDNNTQSADIRELKARNEILEKRSQELTSHMAGVLEASGDLECLNDEFANTVLARTFEDELHSRGWVDLCDNLEADHSDQNEVERIKFITNLIKNAYTQCVKYADNQIRKFLLLSPEDPLPSQTRNQDVYKVRRKYGQKEETREKVKKIVAEIVFNELGSTVEESMKMSNDTKANLRKFAEEFIESSWLMTISNPKLVLNFNAKYQMYAGSIKERFMQYSTQESVVDSTRDKGTVVVVVWPAVELERGGSFLKKGEVITVSSRESAIE